MLECSVTGAHAAEAIVDACGNCHEATLGGARFAPPRAGGIGSGKARAKANARLCGVARRSKKLDFYTNQPARIARSYFNDEIMEMDSFCAIE